MKTIAVQRNLNDGELYEKRLIDIEVQNQWSEVYLYDCGSGIIKGSFLILIALVRVKGKVDQ